MSISILNRGASGGLKPELTVTAPSGSTIDLLQSGIIVDTYTLGADETEHTFVVKVGTYTVMGTLGPTKSSAKIEIDLSAQYSIAIIYPDPVFANNTWAQIINACELNVVPSTWGIGNQKAMTINGTDYAIDIIGKNHDVYTAGGTAPLTFQMHDCYSEKYAMHDSDSYRMGWEGCYMRTTRVPEFLAMMPSEVRNGIKEVNKLTAKDAIDTTLITTADKLFFLSENEIFGKITYTNIAEGSQYAYYSAGNSKIKKIGTGAVTWWGRSPANNSHGKVCQVSWEGNVVTDWAVFAAGVSFAFCF